MKTAREITDDAHYTLTELSHYLDGLSNLCGSKTDTSLDTLNSDQFCQLISPAQEKVQRAIKKLEEDFNTGKD